MMALILASHREGKLKCYNAVVCRKIANFIEQRVRSAVEAHILLGHQTEVVALAYPVYQTNIFKELLQHRKGS